MEIPVQLDERFMEVGFGEWEGRSPNQLRQQDPQGFQRFFEDPILTPPPARRPWATFMTGWWTVGVILCRPIPATTPWWWGMPG